MGSRKRNEWEIYAEMILSIKRHSGRHGSAVKMHVQNDVMAPFDRFKLYEERLKSLGMIEEDSSHHLTVTPKGMRFARAVKRVKKLLR